MVGCAFTAPTPAPALQRQKLQPIVAAEPPRQLRQTQFELQPSTEPIPIISQEQEVNFDGSYKYAYETG